MKTEKIINSAGSISGCASILGSWQICHNVCLGLIFLLSLLGITVVGMPLEFFTRIAIPMWTAAVVLFVITLFFYLKKHCISENIILINYGLIIAGIPFPSLKSFSLFFWIFGGAIAGLGIFLALKKKVKNKTHWRFKMKQEYIMYGLLVVLAGVIIFNVATMFSGDNSKLSTQTLSVNAASNPAVSGAGFRSINSGTTDEGEVSIALTPSKVKDGLLKVSLAANTHSVDLTPFDLKELTTLEFEGKKIKPTSAPKLSGHHASGELVFEVEKELSSFTIKMKGIPKVEERVFNWGD
jgi:hypothetical protein